MRLKKLLRLFMCAAMLTMVLCLSTDTTEAAEWHQDGDYYVTYNKQDGACVVAARKLSGKVTIPETVVGSYLGCSVGYYVTSLGDSAFANQEYITSIDIPHRVKSIGKFAFCYCPRLESIQIPERVTEIADSTFQSCAALKSITIPKNVTRIGEYAFNSCRSLASVRFDCSPTTIGDAAFWDTAISHFAFPDSVTEIGTDVVGNCENLKSIYFGSNISNIDITTFYNLEALETITVHEDNPYYTAENNILYSKDKSTLVKYAPKKTETSFTVPDEVKAIKQNAFNYAEALAHVDIHDNVDKIEKDAFKYTPFFTNESNRVSGVLYLGKHLIDANENTPTQYTVRPGTVHIADYAFNRRTHIEKIVIPNSVKEIGAGAFYSCSALKDIVLPDGLKELPEYIFGSCSSLSYVSIPDTVESIGARAFTDCTSMTMIELPEGVTDIGSNAFDNTAYFNDPGNRRSDGCIVIDGKLLSMNPLSSSYEVVIPDDITLIAGNIFSEYSGKNKLSSIILPESVKYINQNAFYSATSLKKLYCFDKKQQEYAQTVLPDFELIIYNCEGDHTFIDHDYRCDGCMYTKKAEAPTVSTVSATEVTLNATSGREYSLDRENWYPFSTFSRLSPATEYTFYQRYNGSSTHLPGEASDGVTVVTPKKNNLTAAAPVAILTTDTTVVLLAKEGCEYSLDGVNWQKTTVFANLSPFTEYSFYQRYFETDTYYAGAAGEPRKVTTAKTVIAGKVSVTGSNYVGSTLTVDTSALNADEDSLTYQWFRDGQPIDGAAEKAYTATADDIGKGISVEITGTGTYCEAVISSSFGINADKMFVERNGNTYYYVSNKYVTGYNIINNAVYYFGSNGVMYKNRQYGDHSFGEDGCLLGNGLTVEINSKTYHLVNNRILINSFVVENNSIYYHYSDGRRLKNAGYMGMSFDEEGRLAGDRVYITVNNNTYYLIENTVVSNKLVMIDGSIYCFGNDGTALKDGYDSDGNYYDSEGRLNGNNVFVTVDEITYCVVDTRVVINKYVIINDHIYYFGEDGSMCKNGKNIAGYTFDTDGSLSGTDIFITVNNNTYYIVSNTIVKNRYVFYKNCIYYVGNDGCRLENSAQDGNSFDTNGRLKGDKLFVDIENKTYLLVNNRIVINSFTVVDNYIYYFGEDGAMHKDCSADGHTMDADGKLVGNKVFVTVNNNTYYLIDNRVVVNNYIIIDGQIYCVDENGIRFEDGIRNGYCFSGGILRGNKIYVKVDNITYYLINDRIANITGISVKAPQYTVYYPGDVLNVYGMEITVYWEQEGVTLLPVEEVEITGFDSTTKGEKTVTVSYGGYNAAFTVIVMPNGDVNKDGIVDTDDAVYLLYSALFGTKEYPIFSECDFNGDGVIDSDDAIHLLYHILFGKTEYPLL